MIDGVAGVGFAVWAPNARRVSVVGEFCAWDGRVFPMRMLGGSGVWELFVPGVEPGALYKFEMLTREGAMRLKTDPFAAKMEQAPRTAAIVQSENSYAWADETWIDARRVADPIRAPMSIYEVHLGSWARVQEDGNRSMTYARSRRDSWSASRGSALLVELIPVMEHPFYGVGISGERLLRADVHFARRRFSLFRGPLHQHHIGVLLDWVPAHSQRRLRASPIRRHRAVRARGSAPRRTSRLRGR